ncbi:MAG: site-2 protease family protein [DPANN group archaeon]|nr:site-2 protease family protein [DPANN group archaeon]
MIKIEQLGFNTKEIKDIIISTLALAFIFFYGQYGYHLVSNLNTDALNIYLFYLAIIFFAFIPHELAHKFTAIKYGCQARYQIWWNGLKFALILAIVTNGNFVIAAPGAVMIYSMRKDMFGQVHSTITPKENAYISMAGPVANLIIATIMLFLSGILTVSGFDLASSIGYVSCFLAMFNMIPIPPLDGSKIITWNKGVWLGLIVISYVMMGMF